MLHRFQRRHHQPQATPTPTITERFQRVVDAAEAHEAQYTPPAGLPAEPSEQLAYLEAGTFTPEQLRYLHSNAFDIYVAALLSAQSNPELADEVALGYRIVAVWLEIRQTTTTPAPANPFNPAPPAG